MKLPDGVLQHSANGFVYETQTYEAIVRDCAKCVEDAPIYFDQDRIAKMLLDRYGLKKNRHAELEREIEKT